MGGGWDGNQSINGRKIDKWCGGKRDSNIMAEASV